VSRVVLVADDEPDIRFMAALRLRRGGWDVVEAEDGEQAADVVASRDLDALVVDHRMPGRTGIEVARLARTIGYSGPIVLFSAYLDPLIEQEAIQLEVCTLGKADVSMLAEMLDTLSTGVCCRPTPPDED